MDGQYVNIQTNRGKSHGLTTSDDLFQKAVRNSVGGMRRTRASVLGTATSHARASGLFPLVVLPKHTLQFAQFTGGCPAEKWGPRRVGNLLANGPGKGQVVAGCEHTHRETCLDLHIIVVT